MSENTWLSRRWYDSMYWGCAAASTACWGLRIRGSQNVPANGGVLLVSNHQSFLDPVFIGLATSRYPTFLARDTLFKNRILGGLIGGLGAVPITRESGIGGLKTALRELASGKAVIIFPEGTRTPDGKVQPLEPGFLLLCKRAKVPVIPVGIAGAYDVWPRQWAFPVPSFVFSGGATVAVAIGKPVDPALLADMDRDDALAYLKLAIETQVRCAEHVRGRRS